MDNPQPSQLFSQLCDSTLHCVNYVVLFLYQQQILAYYKTLIYNFSPTSLSDFKLLQKDLCVYLCVILFSFLSKSEVEATNKRCLPGFMSWETLEPNLFSKIWDKVLTIFFFYCSQNYILLSNYITDSWRSCEGAVLCHHFLYVTFCVTYDPFSTQRPLVKILQRKVIGKTYSTCSLSDIIEKRDVTLQKKYG